MILSRTQQRCSRSHKKDADGPAHPATAKPASGSRFKFTPRSWKKSSSAPLRGGGASPAGFSAAAATAGHALEGDSGSDSDGTDTLDDSDTEDDIDDDEEEGENADDDTDEEDLSDRRSSAEASRAVVATTRAEFVPNDDDDDDINGRVVWVLKSGEEAKLEGMDMTQDLRIKVGFAPADGSSLCRWVRFFFLFGLGHMIGWDGMGWDRMRSRVSTECWFDLATSYGGR